MFNIMEDTGATEQRCFLTSTDKSNFRFDIYPEYKATRKAPKPKHYDYIRSYLVEEYKAEIVYGQEADDALGESQHETSIICSIDKDLLMIAGKHYNFVKKELLFVTPEEGRYNFYWQLLNGDSGDNIPGCPGIGPKKIEKLIHPDMDEEELFLTCLDTYRAQYEKKGLDNYEVDMLRNGQLLKITKPIWEFPCQT